MSNGRAKHRVDIVTCRQLDKLYKNKLYLNERISTPGNHLRNRLISQQIVNSDIAPVQKSFHDVCIDSLNQTLKIPE